MVVRTAERAGPFVSHCLRLHGYVSALRTANETKLFPTVKKGKSTFADVTGKWYSRLLKKVGLKDQSVVLHGLRHSFITRLSDAGVNVKIRMMLTGHAAQGIHGKVYDHRERVSGNGYR